MIEPLPASGKVELQSRARTAQRVEAEARQLLDQVRAGGDSAVRELTLRFDGVLVENSRVDPLEIAESLSSADQPLIDALHQAAGNIRRVGLAQQFSEEEVVVRPGVRVWRVWRPLRRVGVYVPGGRAPYPSSVLMLCVPAKLAGCTEIVLCSPPGRDGHIDQNILAAASIAGVTEVHAIGGVQAVGAMAYGTETIPRVDKVFGPGNSYVTAAKRLVFGEVAVDMPAGPSEVIVISDGSVPAAWLAADLEAQAEHAPDAVGVLISTDPGHAEQVSRLVTAELAPQLRFYTTTTLEEALAFTNQFGPEHLILACQDPESHLEAVSNAGSIFLGPFSPAAAGDYATGANHVIPTGGAVRSFSPLGLDAFGRTLQVQALSWEGLAELAPVIEPMARAEGFINHLKSVQVRLSERRPIGPGAPRPRASVERMHPYLWESSSAEVAARAGILEAEVVRFDTNTCPWTMATPDSLALQGVNEYPDSNYQPLVSALAAYVGQPTSAITVGAGADELLSLIALAYIGSNDPVVIPDPSYTMFLAVTEAAAGGPIRVTAGVPEELLRATSRARLTWLCNPNNPTGELLPDGLVERVARSSPGIVVVDEAYFEFCGQSSVPLVGELANLVVVRTLSKAFGLAGARVGYAVSGPSIARTLALVRPPASVSVQSAALACSALDHAKEMRIQVAELLQEKELLENELAKRGFKVLPSSANFLLVSCPSGLAEHLADRGLVVRSFSADSALPGWMRVAVRSRGENSRLLSGLDDFGGCDGH
ncbi:MAG TPA: histidinol dehydrogenase [Candidatus Dormibacteraeota bacterium]|nr:histidinol dehydrogenase [Candidatus Dormibacteraeota bacterium]